MFFLPGADIANIVNEAAIIAARNKGSSVAETDFHKAIERVLAGMYVCMYSIHCHQSCEHDRYRQGFIQDVRFVGENICF